jgi:hypothetical protein
MEKGSTFLDKAYALIETCPAGVGGWSEDGQSFFIKDEPQFSALLPKFFRHNNLKSFVRQLNLYGFHKLRNTGALVKSTNADAPEADWIEFRHDRFIRGEHELIKTIQRRVNDQAAKGAVGPARAAKDGVDDTGGAPDQDGVEDAFRDRIETLEGSIRDAQGQALEFKALLEQCNVAVKSLPPLAIAAPLPPPSQHAIDRAHFPAERGVGGRYGTGDATCASGGFSGSMAQSLLKSVGSATALVSGHLNGGSKKKRGSSKKRTHA